MKAVRITSPGNAAVVDTHIPKIPFDDWVLVQTRAVALNPTDWKHIGFVKESNVTVGCDFAGTVHEVGPSVTKWKAGDRVWGCVHGSNVLRPDGGAFAEYAVAAEKLIMRIPDGMSFEDASTAGVAQITVGQGLYQKMGLAWPDAPLEEKKPLLIYGGSSATGAVGIQFAKLSGYEVITTCSPRNFDYMKELGADAVFDYNEPDVGQKIRSYTQNKLYYAWDTIGGEQPSQIIGDSLSSSPPKGQKLYHGTIASGSRAVRDGLEFFATVAYSAYGLPFELGDRKFDANKEDYEWAVKWNELVEKLLEERRWKPHRKQVRNGGLYGVLSGLEDMKNGKVSAAKLVYRVTE